ncbi:HIRAN domain-containing protein [Salinibacterium sp. ZJ70]|uniref:HIRAN domain-containing protein n=1 Tax=Salinibacterium sp. ZJ70 TaxID=2708084 RepID=UPI0014237F3D|nr:HIRAN domain-containing protein [Salinibacterium sp. ZJ70]
MATKVVDINATNLAKSRRTLLLVWQDPNSRRFMKMGQLDALEGNEYAFHYLPEATHPGFAPVAEFPLLDVAYVSNELPAFFANRVLSSDRPNFSQYIEWLGIADLDDYDIPVEVLARTGGGRATDTFHIVDQPRLHQGKLTGRFFVSGIRHVDDAAAVIAHLAAGDSLALELDRANPKNPKAVLINADDGRRIGFVPDWLCGEIHDGIQGGWRVSAIAERVNADAPPHVRVLCRLTAKTV